MKRLNMSKHKLKKSICQEYIYCIKDGKFSDFEVNGFFSHKRKIYLINRSEEYFISETGGAHFYDDEFLNEYFVPSSNKHLMVEKRHFI